jgi:hypothetical protein
VTAYIKHVPVHRACKTILGWQAPPATITSPAGPHRSCRALPGDSHPLLCRACGNPGQET